MCDLTSATFVGATALGVLVDLPARAAEGGVGPCVVAGDHGMAARLLRLSGLDGCVDVYHRLDDAVTSTAARGTTS